MNTTKRVVLTGSPGVGKTTLVKKIIERLQKLNKTVDGFYTEELRSNNNRVGFDVVLLNGKRTRLARIQNILTKDNLTKFKVGQYVVFLQDFENVVLPLFESKSDYFVIDEIGKMELFSERFKDEVEKVFKTMDMSVIVTIPVQKGRVIPLVEAVRTNQQAKLYTVDRHNRNELEDEIINYLVS